jgi:hypothetical protein
MKQIKARRVTPASKAELSPRTLMLAGLGVAAIARREGRSLIARIDSGSRQIAERVQLEVGAAGGRAVELAEQVRKPAAKRAPARRATKPAARKSTRRA